ncbi:DUF3329 domain-containing protein [Devosia sp.]|uniref:DUF3329 domain-containing protein n=1 Tax=Devosia sp. TaxID=1871048 RepID=UPI002FCB8621
MALKQNDLNWFRPLWRRVAVVVFLTAWLAWELIWTRDSFWGFLVGAALAYSLYNFFYAFPKEETDNEQNQPPSPPEGNDGPGS